jgi:YidC/Oxa1 family membrane protein insertase
MEKRLIAATVLSFLVLVGWQLLFVKPRLQNRPRPVEAAATVTEPSPAEAEKPLAKAPGEGPAAAPAVPEAARPSAATAAVQADSETETVVETSLYRAVWSNRGAVLRSFQLKQHKGSNNNNLELVQARSAELGRYPFSLWFEGETAAEPDALSRRLNAALYRLSGSSLELADGGRGELKFEYSDGNGIVCEKTFTFSGGDYEVGIGLKVEKDGRPLKAAVLWGPGIANYSPEEIKLRYSAFSGIAVFSGGRVFRTNQNKFDPAKAAYNFVDWAAYEDNYFTALFVPAAGRGEAIFIREVPEAPTEGTTGSPAGAAAGSGVDAKTGRPVPAYYLAVTAPVSAYIGPKEIDALKAFGHQAKRVINFGAFGAVAEVMLAMVKYFYRLVPNWGLAIILMTVVIKIILFPLTYSSTKSMAKMAEIQPKLKAIRAKYKKAKTDLEQRKQMNEEMMKLYKEHGINPAGGCLPLLIQLPIFWGVFRMLVVSVELRHSPFILWIKDLSVRDPYYVTPILMGATQFISQKMTPTSADPAQARMMLMMPVIMTVFFMNFQSGLVLYWLTTNVLQIGQQALMNRLMAAKKRDSDGKRDKKRA